MYKILIADDEPDVVSLLKDYFELSGYETFAACNGMEVLDRIRLKPDLILLDINMPGMDGLEVCRRIRDYVSCPILFLTAKVEDSDKVRGFAAGGDDYIVKPFSMEELGARVAAHLRREQRTAAENNARFWGKLVLDYSARTAKVEEREIRFTGKEFEILELLSLNCGQVFDKERIYEKLWGYDAEGDSSVVAEHIRRIRAKLKGCGEDYHLETVWGIGYRWVRDCKC
ncbi:MAG: response regulator transcription factor [Clostridium sp.]|nr:response regulator transcription factor [Acetatifactor muris]MCM1526411.1 response regulator transcription factor [Bacteroides sp.]MCM1563226.1 response regulator transcription factor [Clostridium sp.]